MDRMPLGTRRCCDVESTSMTLIQRRNSVVCPAGCVRDLLIHNEHSRVVVIDVVSGSAGRE